MPQIGPLEVLLVGFIALIVFGPQRLPEMARSVGRALAEFRRQASDLREEFSSGLEDDDDVEDETAVPDDTQPAPSSGAPAEAAPNHPPADASPPDDPPTDAVPRV